ncbi:MAG: hypothetical protein G9473_14365 [Erythrobacter sp.]|nr:MAG: hypothetical protein G9473_14365 [Erythrobacter sp.]
MAGRTARRQAEAPRDWRRAMSDHVAYALLVYTGLQIFMTVKALNEGGSGLLPYAALVILVAGIIPACRWFEKRWSDLSDAQAIDPAHAAAFRRDASALWLLAIGLPVALTILIKAAFALF